MEESHKILMIGYDEIGLKGNNRGDFIQQLIQNISAVTGLKRSDLVHRQGRIYGDLDADRESAVLDRLSKVFGVKWFAVADLLAHDYDELQSSALRMARRKKEEGARSFKVETRRSNKEYRLNSRQINVQLGDDIRIRAELEVDVHEPDVTFFVEVRRDHIYLYTDPREGPGGLPVGSNGTVLLLMSGGIDSPVAAWNLMKRGLAVDIAYFHSPPYTGEKALEKVRKMVRKLTLWNARPINLYVPYFTKIQEQMVEQIPESMWTVSQRRFMHLIADRIAARENYLGLSTGDSIGQVASQTIENLQLIDEATNTIVLRPLTGYDKQEIINRAKQIGTYDISIEPYEDCCIMFAPSHPSTRVKNKKLKSAEENLDRESLIEHAMDRMNIETYEVSEPFQTLGKEA